MSNGDKIQALAALRKRRLAYAKKVEVLKGQEAELVEQLMEDMAREGIDRASSGRSTFSFKAVSVPQVADWEKLYTYVKRTGQFQLFQRRVNESAWRELVESGKNPGGIDAVSVLRHHLHVRG
jgi:hypothetical protein